ncbi:hypothetical protein B14911_15082 [Bacillus sp. NRRL B-14911]|nr:hypothetical protein B14911_15082 [Bacillus sp. NRRL B-14911]
MNANAPVINGFHCGARSIKQPAPAADNSTEYRRAGAELFI